MPTSPEQPAIRVNGDYLYSIDPSGQTRHGYAWGTARPDSIFDLDGPDIAPDVNDPDTTMSRYQAFSRYMRMVAHKHPLWLAGPGYDQFGHGIGLVSASGHPSFVDGTPIIDYNNSNHNADIAVGPLDVRYDTTRHVWTAPYTAFPVNIDSVAASGEAFDIHGNTVTGTPWSVYSVSSGLYRYKVTIAYGGVYAGFPASVMVNLQEYEGDVPFLTPVDTVTAMVDPFVNSSGGLVCNERPFRFSAFV